ncbi:hypothetical protein [Methanothrix sp.]|uniref:hypothetical protein n=1 Tax=Methanothrix sp. TaxID=90426 RepID=UPI003BB5A7B9
MAEVPMVFNQEGAAFVLLPTGIKFPPIEKGWQEKAHSYQEATAHNGNVGILAGNGFIGLDQDDPSAFEGLELPLTTTWQTRPGRFGMWFKASDDIPEALAGIGKKADQAQLKLFKAGKPCGEVKLQRTYQVIPPSWKRLEDGTRADYLLLQDVPPAEIPLAKLLADLQALGITFSSKLESNVEKLEEMGREAHQRRAESDESRARRYADAALKDEINSLESSNEGNRNEQLNRSAFALGQFVAAGVLSEAEVIRALSNAAIYAGLEMEEIRATITSGLEAGARHPREIPEQTRRKAEDREPEGPTVLTAFQALINNEDKIKGECVWEWRSQKQRIQTAIKTGYLSQKGEAKAHKFLKQFKGILGDLGIDYDNLYPLLLKPKDNKEEFSDEIKEKAREVLKNEDPVQYVADSCGRLVLGAEAAFKKLISCVSAQNIHQSSGLHPKLTGNSSGGKTWTAYSFAHHLPREAVIKGSMSAKAGFYHSDGDRVFRILDDYQAGNEDLDTVIKQTSSEFHEPYTHRTVIKQIAAKLEIGSEQTWAITSVNNDQDIQVLNRGIPINVDDSVELTKLVNARTVERYGMGEAAKPVDEAVLVCRAMFQILRDEGRINIRVPFWERIEWLDTSNRRNPSIFMDLVIAHTAMLRYQREKDSEGYYLATEDDFQAAKALFTDRDGEELVKRLTRREREVLELMVRNPEGITRADVTERLKIVPQQVSQIFCGQKGQGGLLQKIAIKETQISEMMRINEEQSRTVYKTVYSLKDYDKFAGFDAVVRLKPENDSGESGSKEESREESKSTDSSKQDESKESKNKNKNKNKNRESLSSSSLEGESTLSHAEEKNTFVTFVKATDSEEDTFVVTSSTLSSAHEESKSCVVRFRTDYRTDLDSTMHDFREGDEFEVVWWRAEAWAKRGIVDIAEAPA